MHPYQNQRGKQAAPDPAAAAPVPAIYVFGLRCEARAILVAEGELDLIEAVDAMQTAAVRYGLITDIGQDGVQAIMAEAFRRT
jgi:hypothetical protein